MQEGSVFYRRQQVYNIQDKLPNLDDYIVAGCRFGGPIGVFGIPYMFKFPSLMVYGSYDAGHNETNSFGAE